MEQTERAYQKQPQIFLNHKKIPSNTKVMSSRYVKNIGLGFKTPKEAVTDHYIDKKCPYTGTVSIRGKILTGTVLKMKMKNTIIVRRNYLHFVKKYRRYEKRHKNIAVHVSPCFRGMNIGDTVIVGQCRPLSKTVRFNVIRVVAKNEGKKEFAKF